jgi:hypothetical protein
MYLASKIATCCYCGSRTVLSLTGKVRHELACARCGAPLSRMKNLPAENVAAPARPVELVTEPYRPRKSRPPHKPDRKPKRRKKPKPLTSRLLDLAEDVFDVFD